ncbi:hypothetical protein EK0264_03655 [Epidermidibacterium keratini]|uniref:Uncharacterized protein n=1 Tax=Epidermidibacterium keratini TaxID=1891644 RepID=A0A7L4YJQ9_9ACTN|nr:hypothetical protein [Epidermidibacterium keratini]QHB99465.1 hypothetical protein EK0264_03655 [Epidermidibacterium keratini]
MSDPDALTEAIQQAMGDLCKPLSVEMPRWTGSAWIDEKVVVCDFHAADWDVEREECRIVASAVRAGWKALADQVEPILALLHYRGLVDTETNREDVERAFAQARRLDR